MTDWLHASEIAILNVCGEYSNNVPFHPAISYPEYPFKIICSSSVNPAYDGVREILRMLGVDQVHFGQASWNPLGELIHPGNHVLIKPNLIRAPLDNSETSWECVVTHSSIIRAVMDYVAIALEGNGQITIADGPDTEQDFEIICRSSKLYGILDFYRENSPIRVNIIDTRSEHWSDRDGVIFQRVKVPGDPQGSVMIDLGKGSYFSEIPASRRLFGADYDIAETNRSHSDGHHIYSFSRSALAADVIINLPKMKTHKKTGITLSLKNLVGLNTHRNYLPHYSLGFPDEGGDQYNNRTFKRSIEAFILNNIKPMLIRAPVWILEIARLSKVGGETLFQSTNTVVRSGNWYGNDTTWRMVLDLNKLLFYFDQEGQPRKTPLKYLTLVDGIIAGQKNGPMYPDPLAAGLLVAGYNPLAVDTVCATLMGFDYRKIHLLNDGWKRTLYPLADFQARDVRCISNRVEWDGAFSKLLEGPHLSFTPHFGWVGHIEL